jgi:hypothetical protein
MKLEPNVLFLILWCSFWWSSTKQFSLKFIMKLKSNVFFSLQFYDVALVVIIFKAILVLKLTMD